MKYLKGMGLFAATISLLVLAACGGGNGGSNDNKPPVSITITPMLAMLVGDSGTLDVTVQNTDFTLLSVNPASGSGCAKSGNNAVICTPTIAGTYTIIVRATADATETATAQLNVLEEEIEIDESAGEIVEITSEQGDIRIPISFTAVDSWTASISSQVGAQNAVMLLNIYDDCDVEPKSGPAGNNTVNVTCAPNATNFIRVGDLVITSGGGQSRIPISQNPTPPGVTLTPGTFTAQATLIMGINDSGQMAGSIAAFSGGKGILYSGGAPVDIVHPETSGDPYASTSVSKINNQGQVVGAYWTYLSSPVRIQGFVYHNGAYRDLPEAWYAADFGINDSGHVVGSDRTNAQCILIKGEDISYFAYPGAAQTSCTGINNNGMIVGYFTDGNGKNTGFLYDGSGAFTEISHPDGTDSGVVSGTMAWGINNSGMVAGYYVSRNGGSYGFLHDGNSFVKIISHPEANTSGLLGTMVFDINNSGQIVGSFVGNERQLGFLLEGY